MATEAYSFVGRALHRLAFDWAPVQLLMEDLERALYDKRWESMPLQKPVFIAGLPRAGTTTLLESLYRLPGTVSYTYRDMPFVYAPYLWSVVSARYRRRLVRKERAHGDGIAIDGDSPEAFEEVLWKKWYTERYQGDGIPLWEDADDGFGAYLFTQFQKLLATRCREGYAAKRCISKNNANIARIGRLKHLFPDSQILTPVRDPLEHAISSWRQHHHFKEIHDTEGFSKRYMEDIGHYEFGRLHKPLSFPGFKRLAEGLSPDDLNYWLAYWIGAHEHLASRESPLFLSYEGLCSDPRNGMRIVCEILELPVADKEVEKAAKVYKRAPKSRRENHDFRGDLVVHAKRSYEMLLTRAMVRPP